MRIIVFIVSVSFLTISVNAQLKCKKHSIESSRASIGANIVGIEEENVLTRRIISGIVLDPTGTPIPIGVIDVYKIEGEFQTDDLAWKMTHGIEPWRSYKVDDKGRFCISEIPDGNYIIRVGTNQFLFNHMHLKIKKLKSGSQKRVKVHLELGT